MSNHPKPSFENFLKQWVGDIEKLKKELAEKAPQSFILKDLENLIPKKLSPKIYLAVVNVLMDIINISDGSLWKGWVEEKERIYKRIKNPQYDPRREDIYRKAEYIFDTHNSSAIQMFEWLVKNRKHDVVIRGKKLKVKTGHEDKSLLYMIENSKQIGYTEALEKANKDISGKDIYSEEELINLENGYKVWRKPHKK